MIVNAAMMRICTYIKGYIHQVGAWSHTSWN